MIVILRLGGEEVDLEKLLALTALTPYRVEHQGIGRSKSNCLYFEISDASGRGPDAFHSVKDFLREHRNFLDDARHVSGLRIRDVDVGMIVPIETVMKTIVFDAELMQLLGELDLSLTVSVYKGSEAEG